MYLSEILNFNEMIKDPSLRGKMKDMSDLSEESIEIFLDALRNESQLMENFKKFSDLCDKYVELGYPESEAIEKALESFDFDEATNIFLGGSKL